MSVMSAVCLQLQPFVFSKIKKMQTAVCLHFSECCLFTITGMPQDLDEKVTVVNVPFASVGGIVGKMPSFERSLINVGLSLLKDERLFVTKTVREILFDGYKDPLLDAADVLTKFGIHLDGITSKFGFFFGRNNTWYVVIYF